MLNKVAKKWVKALRSGKFKQAHNQLGTMDGARCCLGVLCELAKAEGVIKSFSLDEMFLPEKVQQWAGLSDNRGNYDGGALWMDNDGVYFRPAKKRFKTIAKIIESNPKGLFEAKS